MNDLELIFSMLGEASTVEIARGRDAQGFEPNKQSAVEGGSIAGHARKDLENRSGKEINFRQGSVLLMSIKCSLFFIPAPEISPTNII